MKDKFKSILIEYFQKKKEARPSDLEDDLLGGGNLMASFMGTQAWFSSPFFEPFKELCQEGFLIPEQDDNGWIYRIKHHAKLSRQSSKRKRGAK